MTIEKTETKDKKNLDDNTKRKLDIHNPVGSVVSDLKQQTVEVLDIEIPAFRQILSKEDPMIEIKVNTKNNEVATFELLLDKFSDDSIDRRMTITNFCVNLGIERDDLINLVGKEIPMKVSKKDGEYDFALPESEPQVDPSDKKNYNSRFQELKNLWKAQEYGKVEIKSIDAHRHGMVYVDVEVPWTGRTQKLKFVTGRNEREVYPDFDLFCDAVLGRTPIDRREVDNLVGEEIEVTYQGSFGLSEEVRRSMNDHEREFTEYIDDNKENFKKSAAVNVVYASIFYALPPFVVVPIALIGLTSGLPLVVGMFVLFALLIISSIGMTLYESYRSYKNKDPIKPIFDFSN